MVETAHDLYFFDEALLPLILTVCCFFGKCLDSEVLPDLQLFSQVDGGEVALSYFFAGLELFVEASLVESTLQHLSAHLKIAFIFE